MKTLNVRWDNASQTLVKDEPKKEKKRVIRVKVRPSKCSG